VSHQLLLHKNISLSVRVVFHFDKINVTLIKLGTVVKYVFPLRGRHFAGDNELKQSFYYSLRFRGREFCSTGTQRLTQRWLESVENDGDVVEKSPIITRDV
jgi:hypothetical protein